MPKIVNGKIFFDEKISIRTIINFETNKTKVNYFDEIWSSDLIDRNDYKPTNNSDFRHFLVAIDNYSNFGWNVPLQRKYSQSKTNFSKIMKKSIRRRNFIETDDGMGYVE